MYNAVGIAELIIVEYNKQYSSPMNITKLHKLLYIVYGVHLSEKETPLFNEEPLCLPYGPVFDSLYEVYKYKDIDLNNKDMCEECFRSFYKSISVKAPHNCSRGLLPKHLLVNID